MELPYYSGSGQSGHPLFAEQELVVEVVRLGMVQERVDCLTKAPNGANGVEWYMFGSPKRWRPRPVRVGRPPLRKEIQFE